MKIFIILIILICTTSISADEKFDKHLRDCNEGEAGSCDMVGFKYQMKEDYTNATKYYTKGCDGNIASS